MYPRVFCPPPLPRPSRTESTKQENTQPREIHSLARYTHVMEKEARGSVKPIARQINRANFANKSPRLSAPPYLTLGPFWLGPKRNVNFRELLFLEAGRRYTTAFALSRLCHTTCIHYLSSTEGKHPSWYNVQSNAKMMI